MATGTAIDDEREPGALDQPEPALPPSRRDRRTARTRQTILDAARELIDEHGFARTTVDQIAERADVAPRTFFRHFASKEAVLFAHVEDHRRRMLELMAARPADEHPFRAVVEALTEFCAVVAENRDRFAWAFRIINEYDLAYEQTMLKAETCDRVSRFIAERLGVDATVDPRPHAWAVVAMTLFGNAMRRALEPGGYGEPGQSFRELVADTAAAFAETTTPEPGSAGA